MRQLPHLLVLLLLGLSNVSATARAAEPAPKPSSAPADDSAALGPVYQEAISQALIEYDLAHYEEARTLFAKAHAIAPSARTWRGLGMVEFELRNYLVSIEALQNALRDPVRRLGPELRNDTEILLKRAKEFVTRVELEVVPAAQSSVLIDGGAVERRSDGSLMLPVGDHVIEVHAVGYRTERRKLSLVGGREERVQIALISADEPPATRSLPPADKPARPVYKNPWLWASVGVVVVGAAALGVTLGMREQPETKYIQGDPQVGDGLIHTLRFGR